MDVLKFVGIGIVISIIAVLTKSVKPELNVFIVISGSCVMLLIVLDYFTQIFSTFQNIVSQSGIDSNIFWLVIKIIGVGYLVEFGASICEDSGNSSIADKVILGGKVIIFVMSLPIVTSLFNIIINLLP